MFLAATSTTGVPTLNPDADYGDNPVDADFMPVMRLRRQYTDYLTAKILEIEEQKQSRHYYHGAQYTAEEIRILRQRRQPVITYNRVARKINGIVGLVERMRQDPKAWPRTPGREEGAEVATATVRYVLDSAKWEVTDFLAAQQAAIEGIGGVELKLVEGDEGDPDVDLAMIFGDDFFYDPRSYRHDFHDSRFMGLARWLDVEAAVELFPDKEDLIRSLVENGYDLTTHADREYKWILVNERRVRLVEHWYKYRGKWCWAFYISWNLLDQGVSPFRDQRNKTIPRFIMFSAAVDHDGDRYGFTRNLRGPQDEINQRRSKALHISNAKRLIMSKNAVDDVERARIEWSRPDGVIEVNPGGEIKPDDTTNDLASQFQFLEEAKNEIESFANVNPAAYSQGLISNLSGRAINLLQAPGMAELGFFMAAYRDWKLRVYGAVWCAVQQFWTSERWIRVTSDQNVAKFLQVNGLDLDEHGRPALVNALGQLDVDIILDEGPDVVNMLQDTYDVVKNDPSIPAQVKIELSPIQGSQKQRILQMLNQPPNPMEQMAKELQIKGMQAAVNEKEAQATERRAKAATDEARAAHLASEAHLNAQEVFARAAAGAAQPAIPQGNPVQPQQPVVPQGQPAAPPMPQGFIPGSGPMLAQILRNHMGPTSPVPGARLAPDGRHYVPDPRRPGKYLMVT